MIPRNLIFIIIFSFLQVNAQDTLSGYRAKVLGEDITYFSPLHRFATNALLTRANGTMPIRFQAPLYTGDAALVVYELLIGHSSGTSGADRRFDVSLNGRSLFTLTTPMHRQGPFTWEGRADSGISYAFHSMEYDINGDAFGFLHIQVPASWVRSQAEFQIFGPNQDSRDWLMVFDYRRSLKVVVEPTALILRQDKKRLVNIYVDNPNPGPTPFRVASPQGSWSTQLVKGYGVLPVPFYDSTFSGKDTLRLVIGSDSVQAIVQVKPVRSFDMAIVHHSHNDIGYSHLQEDVERIQTRNIKTALRWTKQPQAVWQIESLWAVDNFLRQASKEDKAAFQQAVREGRLCLSANYANVLTGLCRREEQDWNTEYARQLSTWLGKDITMAMITDIPGISASALESYTRQGIRYLSIGANYVETLPDKGDRIGGVLKAWGDKPFYWQSESGAKLLVWHAGKGYSYFHNIAEKEKEPEWENRISKYVNQLTESDYPYDVVQLRYTQHADNGPVDTALVDFVNRWNQKYTSPSLRIENMDSLFDQFEKKYGDKLPVYRGEISPYWEDGAYSTAREESANRELSAQTIRMEQWSTRQGQYDTFKESFRDLHRDIIMFHEHTWGSWCSISDPDLPFTLKQWDYKRSFLDSGLKRYLKLAQAMGYTDPEDGKQKERVSSLTDFTWDPSTGSLTGLFAGDKQWVDTTKGFGLFEMIYRSGTDSVLEFRPDHVEVVAYKEDRKVKSLRVKYQLKGLASSQVTYELDKNTGELKATFTLVKLAVREKESLHLAIPLALVTPEWHYGDTVETLTYGVDQLPGSNFDFIGIQDRLIAEDNNAKLEFITDGPNLVEIGTPVDEHRVQGAKTWRSSPVHSSTAFLYLMNNYWHTNYKADQFGEMQFSVNVRAQ